MKVLLDTNVFLWLQTAPDRLGRHLDLVADPDNQLLVSAATSWEIAIKFGLDRLPLPEPPARYVPSRIRAIGAIGIPIEHAHVLAVADLPRHHRDPFDRLLVAQGALLDATLLTGDSRLERYGGHILVV